MKSDDFWASISQMKQTVDREIQLEAIKEQEKAKSKNQEL